MLIIEILKKELNDGHIEIMLIIEIPKIEMKGGHIGILLIRDSQNRIKWRPYWNYSNYRDYQNRL